MKRILALATGLGLLFVIGAAAAQVSYTPQDGEAFIALLSSLEAACMTPTDENLVLIEERLNAVAEPDKGLAKSIADHWRKVYLDPDYYLYLFSAGKESDIPELPVTDHAIIVLGYALKDGEMLDELKGRCQAAASLARTYPESILVCSGGATGSNNPDRHTEAGLMKQYLSEECGVSPDRIYTDERAMSTAENAINTLVILQEQGITSMTIVTSSYHQRWAQVLYHALAEIYRMETGYDVELVSNFCLDIEPENKAFRKDYSIALRQLSQILNLPKE